MEETDTTSKRPIGTISIDTKVLYERLRTCKIGEVVTYQDMSAIIGRDVREKASWTLQSARRKALHDDQMVFATVSKIGIKRLTDEEIVATGHDAIRTTHRRAVRSIRKLSSVQDFAKLKPTDKVRHNAYASVLGMLAHVTKEKQVKRIEEVVTDSQNQIAVQRTLQALTSK